MNLQKKQVIKAFTLVELIVVITILAILGTIAFISLQGYSTSARDSTRVSDISSMKTSLELFQLDAGKYPMPSNSVEITYSGAIVWYQGTFGENVFANVDRLDKIPTDPVNNKEYTYSITSTKYQYQIGGMIEGDEISYIPLSQPFPPREKGVDQFAVTYQSWGDGLGVRDVSAGTTEATAYVTGNYNEQLTKALSGSICKVLAVPSIISNDTAVTDLEQILSEQKLVFRGYKNLPASFKTSKFKYDGGFDFTPNQLIAYSDTGSCSELTNPNSSSARVLLLKGLQDSYSGTILKEHGEIKNILSLNINTSSPSSEVINYAGNYVNNALGGNIATSGASSSSSSSSTTSSSGGPSGWMLLDTNCDIPDITIGSQTWAGCNSTLGNGVERGKQDNGTNGTISSCSPNYNGNNDTTNCVIGSTSMASTTKANTWYNGTNASGDQEFPAIWGKLYTWENTPTACPSGRHLPTDAEWETLETTLNGSNCRNATNGWLCTGLGWKSNNTKTSSNNIAQALKLPLAGMRDSDGSSFNNRGNYSNLWSSTSYNATSAYHRFLYYNQTTVVRSTSLKTIAYTARCIKDIPNSYPGCDTLDITVGSYTISACNVGTNTAGTGSSSYGNYFQWGNNGGTPSGDKTLNSNRVNASSYGPGNYYNNTTFIGYGALPSPYDWTNPQNNNLWGDDTDGSVARQGPCASGYHIPSRTEWVGIVSIGGWGSNGANIMNALKLPMAGNRSGTTGTMTSQASNGLYWSSSPNGTNAYSLRFHASIISPNNPTNRAAGDTVRCFKN